MELLKKENLLIIVGLTCLALYWYSQTIKEKKDPWVNQTLDTATKFLPIAGGLAFGLNTLLQIAK